jgi:transcriptional regulator with XRE-family HTH domain
MGKDGYSKLNEYVLALCKAQNLSLRQAALRSGVDTSTISKMLQRDGESVARPDTLERLAAGLNGDYLQMMRLAGYLPEHKGNGEGLEDAELQAKIAYLEDLIVRVAEKDRDAARRLLGMVIAPFEIMLDLKE